MVKIRNFRPVFVAPLACCRQKEPFLGRFITQPSYLTNGYLRLLLNTMPPPRHLVKAPIKEAVIDIQLSAKTSLEALKRLGRDLGYRTEGEHIGIANIELDVTKVEATKSTISNGFKFTSEDGRYVCQFRTNGVTISRLEPYQTWDLFFREALRAWEAYTRVATVEAVTRIAVRNINHLFFPLQDFARAPQDYLTSFAHLPKELEDKVKVGQWVFRYHVEDHAKKIWAFFTQVSRVSDDDIRAGRFSMILDVDAYSVNSLPTTMTELTPLLDELHHFKNTLFFSAVTETTLAKFS